MQLWTREQIEKIKRLYSRVPKEVLVKELAPHSLSGIRHKANRLGLKREVFSDGRHLWSEEEKKILIENYSKVPKKDLLKLIPQTTLETLYSTAHYLRRKRKVPQRSLLVNIAERKFNLSDVERGYLAGFIDGEGAIGIFRHGSRHIEGDYYPRVTIVNSCRDAIEFCHKILGCGELGIQRSKTPRHKDRWFLRFGAMGEVLGLLKEINLLIVKKRQGELVTEFIESRLLRAKEWKNGKWLPYTDRELKIVKEVYELNRKGKLVKAREKKS